MLWWGGGGGAGVSSLLLDLGLTTVSPVLHPVTRAGWDGGGGGGTSRPDPVPETETSCANFRYRSFQH